MMKFRFTCLWYTAAVMLFWKKLTINLFCHLGMKIICIFFMQGVEFEFWVIKSDH